MWMIQFMMMVVTIDPSGRRKIMYEPNLIEVIIYLVIGIATACIPIFWPWLKAKLEDNDDVLGEVRICYEILSVLIWWFVLPFLLGCFIVLKIRGENNNG